MTSKYVPFAKGFRPFFWLAAFFAVSFLPTWLLVFAGSLNVGDYWSGAMWHGHEMIFGFTLAVVAGFLLTAVSNWTGRETATGPKLFGLCAVWLLGRVAVGFAGWLPAPVVAVSDLLFLPALAAAIGRPLIATGNRRNFVFIAILGVLWLANVVMHLGAMGILAAYTRTALIVSMDVIILVSLIIGGRIIPMFTRNATGAKIRSHGIVEKLTIIGMLSVIALTATASGEWFTGVTTIAVGVIVAVRMTHWGTKETLDKPILWVLHLGHGWIALGLVLRGLATFTGAVTMSAANHVLTVGAIGTLTLGMMSRVALGHTGRDLEVSRPVVWAFVLLTTAVVVRAFLPVAAPSLYMTSLVVSGTLWALAFGIYLVSYTPVLFRPRVDGRPG